MVASIRALMMTPRESLSFGPFDLDPSTGELCKDGRAVELPRQPAQALILLVENAGRVVTRDEMHRSIWGDKTFVDFEQGLNFCIRQIRVALADDARNPRFVETVPRVGYRFIAPVRSGPTEAPGNEGRPQRSSKVKTNLPALAAAAVILVLGAALAVFLTPGSAPAGAVRANLAVLPFDNMTSDPGQDHLSDGLTEEIITTLSRLDPERIGVIARTSVMGYKSNPKPVSEIGRELGVRYVLEGSVRREGDRVRVSAQLIRVEDQSHVWAETFDRESDSILELQRDLAETIASTFRPVLASDAAGPGGGEASPEGFEAYLMGRFLLSGRNPAELPGSVEQLRRAVELDPGFGPAHAYLGRALLRSGLEEQAAEASRRALELDETLVEPRLVLSLIALSRWDWRKAERELASAIALSPSHAESHRLHAILSSALGRHRQAMESIETSLELDPLSMFVRADAALYYYFAGKTDEAIAQCRRVLEVQPSHVSTRGLLAVLLDHLGREDAAMDEIAILLEHQGMSEESIAQVRSLFEARGLAAVRRAILDRIEPAARAGTASPYQVALLYADLGDADQAVAWLERTMQAGSSNLLFLGVEPRFSRLHEHPGYRELLLKANLAGG